MRLNFKNTTVDNVKEVSARIIGKNNDYLESFEDLKSEVKFENFFVVSSSANTQRGQHAHLRATQYLFCLAGLVEVEVLVSPDPPESPDPVSPPPVIISGVVVETGGTTISGISIF